MVRGTGAARGQLTFGAHLGCCHLIVAPFFAKTEMGLSDFRRNNSSTPTKVTTYLRNALRRVPSYSPAGERTDCSRPPHPFHLLRLQVVIRKRQQTALDCFGLETVMHEHPRPDVGPLAGTAIVIFLAVPGEFAERFAALADGDVDRCRHTSTASSKGSRRSSRYPVLPLHERMNAERLFMIDRGQDLVPQFHEGDIEAAMDEVFDPLQTDEPPPTTTARALGRIVWKPEYLSIPSRKLMPLSIHSRMARASGALLTCKMPCRSMPGDSTSLS
jgi:hypothetical protein